MSHHDASRYDSLEQCPTCKDETPHKLGLIAGGKVCLVCGTFRLAFYEGTFQKCQTCGGFIRLKNHIDAGLPGTDDPEKILRMAEQHVCSTAKAAH